DDVHDAEAPDHNSDDHSSSEDEVGRQLNEELRASPVEESPDTASNDLTAPLSADLDTSNILATRRKRKAPNDPDFYNYFVAPDENSPAVLAALATGLHAPRPQNRSHRDDLPPEPRNWNEVLKHPFKDHFIAAAEKELD